MNNKMVSFLMDGILDHLLSLEDQKHTAPWGQVLVTLAEAVVGYNVSVGDPEYHFTSRAVILLEEMGLVTVERAYDRRKGRANTLISVALNQ